MKNIIEYAKQNCVHCIRCVKSCPVNAVYIENKTVHIDSDKCIYCDTCVQNCPEHALEVKGAHMHDTFPQFDYKVALIPTAILTETSSYEQLGRIAEAIRKLGFDEVVDYSDIEGALYRKAIDYAQEHPGLWLTSMCPAMNRYIINNYPTLMDQLLPFEYPVEIAAKRVRERTKDKGRVGIYSICECIAKLSLAKEPFGNENSNIDYAMSVSHIFPKINKLISDDKSVMKINRYGIKSNVAHLFGNKVNSIISVEGLNQCQQFLELAEFDRLKHIDLAAMYACYQGCVGGYFLWNNPFEGSYNIESLLEHCHSEVANLSEEEYSKTFKVDTKEQSVEERIIWFNKVNEILEQLPQYDCGSCGYANCRGLAMQIAKGEADISRCRVRKG